MTSDSTALPQGLPPGLGARLALEAALTGLSPAQIVAEALAAHLYGRRPRRRRLERVLAHHHAIADRDDADLA